MKIVILNKSDRQGGAAIVSMRLMEALRAEGADARMVVAEKTTESPYVSVAASKWKLHRAFLSERLQIFLNNGMRRSSLFKVDTASYGVDVSSHPWVKEADVVMLNWVNQGFVSLKGIRRLAEAGKRLIWTMHDLWCMTGICHHTGGCDRYRHECGECHFLGSRSRIQNIRQAIAPDLSCMVHRSKTKLYDDVPIQFVAVSSWLQTLARESSLLRDKDVVVIPNAFEIGERAKRASVRERPAEKGEGKIRILMGAARLDDPIKGLPLLVEATRILAHKYPDTASRTELVTFGGIRDPHALEGMGISHTHLGSVRGEEALADLYSTASVVVSTSEYETLPGTLIEGQAYGAVPVSFDRGGQRDIIDPIPVDDPEAWNRSNGTGFLVPYTSDLQTGAEGIADALHAAVRVAGPAIRARMLRSVENHFIAREIAQAYLRLCR